MDKVMICLDHTWLPREYMRVDLTDRVIVSDRASKNKIAASKNKIILPPMLARMDLHEKSARVLERHGLRRLRDYGLSSYILNSYGGNNHLHRAL